MRNILLLPLATCIILGCSPRSVSVSSPDGSLSLTLALDDAQTAISVSYKGTALIDRSPVGIDFADGFFGKGVTLRATGETLVVDDYTLPTGKASAVHSESNERTVSMTDKGGRKVEIVLRAFDDGVAYRYIIPEQEGMEELSIRGEQLDLGTVGDPVCKGMTLPGFTCSHENYYTTKPLSEYEDSTFIDMPLLLTFPGGELMAITEAMVVDYAGMMMTTEGGKLRGRLSPRLDGSGLCVAGGLPRRSPWRVFQVSDRAGALLESTILTTLADPCAETGLSWLDPGTSSWDWWNGYQAPAELLKGDRITVNERLARHYIDFCAENGIKYHSITGLVGEGHKDICWYYNEGSAFSKPDAADDASRPYPGYDVEGICRYAGEKGVQMRAWVHWETLDRNMEEAFSQYGKWGIKGLMVDFMDRDDEEMIAYQKKVLEAAMKHHLHIQFHGASKPSGLQRTYPCEFTRENTKNYECYKWDPKYSGEVCGAAHDLDVAFTRCLAGPTDYHLGSFRAVKAEDFTPVRYRPVTTCTRSHSLALYVVYESALQLVSDAPEAYRGEPGFEFIQQVPAVWDETRVPLAEVDRYAVVARRSGPDWYVGCIGDAEGRELSLPLGFLGEGEYTMTLYKDAEGSDENLNLLETVVSTVRPSDTLDVRLAPCGGFAAIIRPAA